MANSNITAQDRTLSVNSVAIYIDTEKRQSVAIALGTSYQTVEKLLRKINSNPGHYQHQTCVIIEIYWDAYIWWIVLIIFMIILLLTFFFAFFPDNLLKIWKRAIWFYLCIAANAFIIVSVIIYYIIQYCDKSRWTQNELDRINVLIQQSNTIEYSDKHNYKIKTDNWSDWTDSEDDYAPNNRNNLHYVYLKPLKVSRKERDDDVIKIIVEIWLENKNIQSLRKKVSNINEMEQKDKDTETDEEMETLIQHTSDELKVQSITPLKQSKQKSLELVGEMKSEQEIQPILNENETNSD
eukprot:6904_1